jgi:hypothetical protein
MHGLFHKSTKVVFPSVALLLSCYLFNAWPLRLLFGPFAERFCYSPLRLFRIDHVLFP